jgi:electron transfer flavoprotein alpha subunit
VIDMVEARLRIAALIKQIPQFETMNLGTDGRLVRAGLPLEMNAYCRRAVAEAVELAAQRPGSEVVAITLGPPSADDVLRESIAWGDQLGFEHIRGVHVTDPAFAGSDTLATARALTAALRIDGPFDLILCGRNSVDADTGQVGPQIAELLGFPFVTGVRHLHVANGVAHARAELDDGWMQVEATLPALLSCAERLCEPSKVDPPGRASVAASRIRRVAAAELGTGPWGAVGSPTRVGTVRTVRVDRDRLRWPTLPVDAQVDRVIVELTQRRLRAPVLAEAANLPPPRSITGPAVVALVEPNRRNSAAELLGATARLASDLGGYSVAIGPAAAMDTDALGALGADLAVAITGSDTEVDLATAIAGWLERHDTPVVLAPSTAWGREIAARVAARTNSGLTGDAIDVELAAGDVELEAGDVELAAGRLVAWKPAFGGAIVAAITADSPIQMVTVRAGVLPTPQARTARARTQTITSIDSGRIRVLARTRDDDIDLLAEASAVIGVGRGVEPDRYAELEPLRAALGAEYAATRKVTDNGWMPRARQVGITGRSISPSLYVSIGASGKFNHTVGFRNATTVLAINADPDALVFDAADIGIVGDWSIVVASLAARASEWAPTPRATAPSATTPRV